MGFISRKVLPACGSMCVCCPALRPSSQRPVKRCKNLLVEIFPKTLDGPPNEKKITKLCEYAAKNPHCIPKRSYKELRTGNINFIKIIREIYSKFLYICKEKMAYFATSLLNVIIELLDHKQQETIQILGCQSLTTFIYSQADSTYAHNIESLVHKVCMLASENGEENKRLLRAASLQCLTAMVWFMTEYSYFFTDFDEECENPVVWSHICIQKLAELAKESTAIRCVLDVMLIYFDTGRRWAARDGLALRVLSDMSYFVKCSGFEQMILAAVIRHLDHKNVVHDPLIKSDIVQIATCLVRQLRSQAVVAEIGVASDLCRHLRKSLQAAMESVGSQESNWNDSLQNSIEDCLMEIAKGMGDAYPLFDMMAFTLEKLPAPAIVARATIESLLIVADIISLTSINSHQQFVFPENLLLQLIKIMMHPDVKTCIGAHRIFSVILVQSPSYPRHEDKRWKWNSKSTSAFASAAALFEKLRRGKEYQNLDKVENYANDDISIKDMDEVKNGRIRKTSPYFHKLSSAIDRTAVPTSPAEAEANLITLNEDQTAQLLSALWLQANQPDNLPSNFEAIAHSFSFTLLSSRLKELLPSLRNLVINLYQVPLRKRWILKCARFKVCSAPFETLDPSCQRSLLTIASGMLAFAGKIYQMTELADALRFFISLNVDPFLKIGDDLQIHIRPECDLRNFGSEIDQQATKSLLADLRKMVLESRRYLLDIIIRDLSDLTNLEKDELAMQLSETFTPEDVPLFGSIPLCDWDNFQTLAISEGSISLDEELSRTSSINGDIASESTATDLHRLISRIPTKPSMSPVVSVGQLLESALHVAGQVSGTSILTSPLPYGTMASQCEALGMVTRKKLSTCLVNDHDSVEDDPLPALPMNNHSGIEKIIGYEMAKKDHAGSEQLQALRFPPASPFDNFMRVAGC